MIWSFGYLPERNKDLDITEINYSDNFFDIVYCSHVLEHIPDDARAMKELFRVLKPGGWAIIKVPIDKSLTIAYEDPSTTTAEERLKHFGQKDHVRSYGIDYRDRLEKSGFGVTVITYASRFTNEEKFKFGLPPGEDIYHCTKSMEGIRG